MVNGFKQDYLINKKRGFFITIEKFDFAGTANFSVNECGKKWFMIESTASPKWKRQDILQVGNKDAKSGFTNLVPKEKSKQNI